MASVIYMPQLQTTTHTNNHLCSDIEPLSLSLDLSLGGLFSKNNGSFHASEELSLKASQEFKACVTPPVGPTNSQSDFPVSVDGAPLPVASHDPADHFGTRSLQQAQRRHEAQKRRKSRINGKLHKRKRGCFQTTDEVIERFFQEAGRRDQINCEESMYISGVLACAHSDNMSPTWVIKNEPKCDPLGRSGIIAEAGTVESEDLSTGCLQSVQRTATVDFLNVLGYGKDVQMGMLSAVPSEVSHDALMDGDVSSMPWPSASCLQLAVPSESMLKHAKPSDIQNGLNGDVRSPVKKPSSLSSSTSAFSHLTSCVPYEISRQKDQPQAAFHHAQIDHGARLSISENAYCSEGTIPTCGSLNQLLSWHTEEDSDNKQSCNDDGDNISECMDKGSSSEIENDCARKEQGNNDSIQLHKIRQRKQEQAELAQQMVTMPAIYPPPFPIMPLPYPYGLPLPYPYGLPWFTQGGLSQNIFGTPVSSPPSVEQAKEAFNIPFCGFPNPYHLPLPGNNITGWLPFIPAGSNGTSAISEKSRPVPRSGSLYSHPDHMKGQATSEFGQDIEGKEDLACVHDMQAEAVVGDRAENVVAKVKADNYVHAVHMTSDQPCMKEKTKENGYLVGHGKLSPHTRPCKQLEKGDTLAGDSIKAIATIYKDDNEEKIHTDFKEPLAGGRQHESLPDLNRTVSKKKKRARYNSFDGAEVREVSINETFRVNNGDDSTSCRQSVGALHCRSTQRGVVISNADLASDEVGPEGSCVDQSEKFNFIEGNLSVDMNLRVGDKYYAENVMHSDNRNVVKMDRENVEGDSSAISHPCKSAIEFNLVGRKSLSGLMKVITHGSGPNGKSIHGFMYITSEKQPRLICVCHGQYMSPLEFVQHSGSSDLSNPERSIVLESFSYADHDSLNST